MPFYDYKCASCGKIFEIMRGMNETAITLSCPFCGSQKAGQVFYAPQINRSGTAEHHGHGSCGSCSSGSCGSCSSH